MILPDRLQTSNLSGKVNTAISTVERAINRREILKRVQELTHSVKMGRLEIHAIGND
jgi:hypothetical protein